MGSRSHGLDPARRVTDSTRNPLVSQPPLLQPEIGCSFSPTRCPFGGACHTCPAQVQTKLKIGAVNDPYEQEADRIAEHVMRMPETTQGESDDQCHLPGCSRMLQRQSPDSNISTPIPPAVHDVLHSPGQPLNPETQAYMETRFGHDFSQVRVHADTKAAESAQSVNALAYTVGRDIAFAAGRYAPSTLTGRELLAHELAHTIQQGKSNPFEAPRSSDAKLQRLPDSTTGTAAGSANAVAGDDGVTPSQARQALVRRIGEERLRWLLTGGSSQPGEAEAGRAARQVVSGRQAPHVARMAGVPNLQRVGPVVVITVALGAVIACALGFYHYAMDHYANRSDKWLHCYTSCKIATYCGGDAVAVLLGAGKEVLDYICDQLGGPCGAEWQDFVADLQGIGCAHQFWRRCTSCCDEARPS
jgi:hypothetical protein